MPAAAASAGDAAPRPFRSRHGDYAPAGFDSLPGWGSDRIGEAWGAFLAGCRTLERKPAWQGPCRRAAAVNPASEAALREFFEREFFAYQIREPDRSPSGVITGYYEPLLDGSRRHGAPYLYPVYGVPDDLLYLDARRLPPGARGRAVPARIDGRSVIPIGPNEPLGTGFQLLEVGEAQPDIRDRRLRLRLEGRRIVPYPARAVIESGALSTAPVLAWVADPVALYSMQIQGSGRIRLAGGGVLRVGYAEQNGQPFRPALAFLGNPGRTGASRDRVPLTRGLSVLAEAEEGSDDAGDPDDPGDAAPPTRGLPRASARRASARPASSPEVRRLIELLRPGAAARPAAPALHAEQGPPASGVAARNDDPSYVFFRPVADTADGPPGALGVPLTPGRSVAVDPRTTPLGAPVYLSTTLPGGAGQLDRLVLAQDTGGAIRGAVRADYFWGFGPGAGREAARMKQPGRMWLLLPRELGASLEQVGLTRGAGRAGPGDGECVLPDPDFCVED